LPNRTKLSLTVASSHFNEDGRLGNQEWNVVETASNEIVFLEETRQKLLEYLTTQMQIIAPNTSKLVGAAVCAKLIAAAGGLYELSLTPACNI
jgi:RNA processing factor Prp31